jgi:hypothetical protein
MNNNRKQVGAVTLVKTQRSAKVEFHIPTGMDGKAFTKWKSENANEVNAFKAEAKEQAAKESAAVEGDTGGRE